MTPAAALMTLLTYVLGVGTIAFVLLWRQSATPPACTTPSVQHRSIRACR